MDASLARDDVKLARGIDAFSTEIGCPAWVDIDHARLGTIEVSARI